MIQQSNSVGQSVWKKYQLHLQVALTIALILFRKKISGWLLLGILSVNGYFAYQYIKENAFKGL